MQDWHSTCLGRRTLPRDLSAFENEAFFNLSEAERRVIEDRRGSTRVLLMMYAGILAHGTALSAAETARMIQQLSPGSVRQAMKWASRRPLPGART